MKRLFMLFLLFIFLTGCTNGVPINFGAPKLPAQLCIEHDPSNSYILMVSSQKGVPLNELYYGFLDVTQIGLITEALDKDKVRTFMVDVGGWYDEHYPVSYTILIEYMTSEAAKVQGITAILNRRIGIYQSPLIISNYDDCLLRAGWNDAMDQLFLR